MDKCNYCEIDSPFLLYTATNGKDRVSACPNHACMENFICKMESSIEHKCLLCGKDGYSFSSDDFKVDLCKDHIYSLIDLKLTPKEYFTLRKEIGDAYIIHDDFYCEVTGLAIQPNLSREY